MKRLLLLAALCCAALLGKAVVGGIVGGPVTPPTIKVELSKTSITYNLIEARLTDKSVTSAAAYTWEITTQKVGSYDAFTTVCTTATPYYSFSLGREEVCSIVKVRVKVNSEIYSGEGEFCHPEPKLINPVTFGR